MDYETVKATVLRAYELVREAYEFRACEKAANQSDFAGKKTALLDKWCAASKLVCFDSAP